MKGKEQKGSPHTAKQSGGAEYPESKTEEAEGIQIRLVNRCMMTITCILAAGLLLAAVFTEQKYSQMMDSATNYLELEKTSYLVREASDYLTEQARYFAATGQMEYMELYFTEANDTQRRERALEILSKQDIMPYDVVKEAVDASVQLMDREYYTMKLVCLANGVSMEAVPPEVRDAILSQEDAMLGRGAMLEKAQMMLFDTEYQEAKDKIHGKLYTFGLQALDFTEKRMEQGGQDVSQAVSAQRTLLVLMIALNLLNFIFIARLVVKPLGAYLEYIRLQTPMKPSGAYEFCYLAKVYNQIRAENEAIAAKEVLLRHKAEHDLMTGLRNRSSAEEQIRRQLRESKGIFILLDLDDLKNINDTYGHREGDRAIIGVAETLREHFRDRGAIIGRIGGDEFVVFLADAAGESKAVSQSLNTLLRKLSGLSVGKGEEEYHIHCSIGCAEQLSINDTYETLFRQADTALYHVKRNGKNNAAFYVLEMGQIDKQFRAEKLLTQKSESKFENAELQELLNSIATFYQLVLSVNISTNTYYLMEEPQSGILDKLPAFGVLDQFVELMIQAACPEDATGCSDKLSKKALLRAYQQGAKNLRHCFRLSSEEGYRWVEATVIFYTNGRGDVCSFTLLRWADERAEELERMNGK